jgi:23S rRNA pseudouridine2605 synthase
MDQVRVDGSKVNVNPELRTFALHKPRGVTTTMRDPHAERDLSGFLPKGVHVFPVGRLDRDTEGLLLLTNDGSLAHRLTHPRYAIEKEYLAEVDRPPSHRQLARLRRGVELDDGTARAVDARSAGGAAGRGGVRLVMVEGRKREVRRMLDAVELPVRRLVRVRVGPIRLGKLRPGDVRELEPEDVRALFRATGL